MKRPRFHTLLALTLSSAAIGCASTRPVMPTPDLYRDHGAVRELGRFPEEP